MSKFGRDRYFFGSVKVGDRGQIVIPSRARKIFKIESGDQLLVFGDLQKGLGIIKATALKSFAMKFFQGFDIPKDNDIKEKVNDEGEHNES